jgi:uncharacterized membrane protein YvbJ
MRCPSCHSENPENARFCIECGAAFERHCLKCGFENLPQAKFCGRCGAGLTDSDAFQTSDGSTTNMGARGDDALKSYRPLATILVATILAWVSEAGFQSVDCFWRYLGTAIFGGIKTKSTTVVDPDLFARAARSRFAGTRRVFMRWFAPPPLLQSDRWLAKSI